MNRVLGFGRRIRRSLFLRNVGLLAGATAVGQLTALIVAPVLTRLYSPDDFGVLAVYSSVLGVAAVVAGLRFEQAILIATDDQALDILALTLLLVLASSSVVLVATAALGDSLVRFTGAPALRPYLWMLPVGTALVGAYNSLSNWALRCRTFGVIARTRLHQAIGSVLSQISLGVVGFGAGGLIVGNVIGQAAGSLSLLRGILSHGHRSRPSLNSLQTAARRYWRFPALGTPAALLNQLGLELPNLLLAGLYGPQVAGWMLLARRVLSVPMGLLGNSIGQVYFAEAARVGSANVSELRKMFVKTTVRLLFVGAVPAVVFALAAPLLFATVFGDDWRVAGTYARYLTVMAAAQFVSTPTSQTFVILERQGYSLALNAAKTAIAASALIVPAGLGLAALAAVATYATSMALYYVLVVFASLHVMERVPGASPD